MIGFYVNVCQFNDQLKENERLWRAIQSLGADAGLQDISQNHRSVLQEWEIELILLTVSVFSAKPRRIIISALFS